MLYAYIVFMSRRTQRYFGFVVFLCTMIEINKCNTIKLLLLIVVVVVVYKCNMLCLQFCFHMWTRTIMQKKNDAV